MTERNYTLPLATDQRGAVVMRFSSCGRCNGCGMAAVATEIVGAIHRFFAPLQEDVEEEQARLDAVHAPADDRRGALIDKRRRLLREEREALISRATKGLTGCTCPIVVLGGCASPDTIRILYDAEPPGADVPIGDCPPASALWGKAVHGLPGVFLPAEPKGPLPLSVFLHGPGGPIPLDPLPTRSARSAPTTPPPPRIPMSSPEPFSISSAIAAAAVGVPYPAVAPTDSIPLGVLPEPACQLGVALVDSEGLYYELQMVVDEVDRESGAVDGFQLGGGGRWLSLPKWDHDASERPRMGWF